MTNSFDAFNEVLYTKSLTEGVADPKIVEFISLCDYLLNSDIIQPNDRFRKEHVEAFRKYLNGAKYYAELYKDMTR